MRNLLIKYTLALIVAQTLFSKNSFCQIIKSNYSSYKNTADSILKLYYRNEELKYINLDSNSSFYRTLKNKGGGTFTKFTKELSFEPEMFDFHYLFTHPSFKKDTLNIKFYVDKSHRIMEGFLPEGLFDMSGLNKLKIISKKKALNIAKKSKIKNPLIKYEIELGWEEQEANLEDYKKFNQTKDIKNIVKGRIVWRVKSNFRNEIDSGEEVYSEIFIIDAITGKVIGEEHEKNIIG